MKKSIFLYSLTIGILTLLPFRTFPQTAQDILEKMIEAQGGRSALEKIQDTKLTGYMEMVQMGLGGSLTTYQKEPNKLRMDATVQGTVVTQSFDGETAWMTNPLTGMVEKMPPVLAEDFGRSALGNDAFLDPEKFKITYTLVGKELIEGREYFILLQNFSDGFEARLLIDSETFLIYKTKTTSKNERGEDVEIETIFSDYKNIDGILIAHTLVTFQENSEFMRMTITDVEFNTGLEDVWFIIK
jgi:outer membrane lipoprotein-sorting protein